MNTTPRLDFGPVEDQSKDIIKVVGVGGGGCNAVNNMYREKIVNVSFAVCNTDSQSLKDSPVPVKLQLGEEGLGAGANPDKGKQEAEASRASIKKLFSDNTKMCFITAGMGGGTGTGSGPVVASVAKEMGILTVGIVTIPFYFEKRNKIIKALKGVEEMRKNVDTLLIVNNERICDIYSDADTPVKEAFKSADRILSDATKSISELITVEGTINLDFRDVQTTMSGGGGAIMAIGRGSGDKRVQKAILDALDSPLLYGSDISKAKKILFNIYTSEEAPLFVREMQEIDAFMYELDPNIDVIWGASDDNSLGQDAKIILLATGLDNEFMPIELPHGEDDELAFYNKVIEKLYREDLTRGKSRISSLREEKPVEKEEPETPPTETILPFESSENAVLVESSVPAEEPTATTPSEDAETSIPNGHTAPTRRPSRKLSFLDRVKQRINETLTDVTKGLYEE